ncbi:MAG TPA: hypothetical protein VFD91_08320 [Mariniphaga sp.]|nr:hypothetical protein [Mariniphaga sp.]
MKSLALFISIHIPVIYHKHPFSEIAITEEYIDTKRTEEHTKNLVKNKLAPFLNTVHDLWKQFGESFKLGFSISGISIRLLQKYTPEIINKIKFLADRGAIEFFAEPWSHSVLSLIVEKELVQQTELHREIINKLFNQTPTAFLATTTLNAKLYNQFEPFPGCKTIFTYSNHISQYGNQSKVPDIKTVVKSEFLINYFLSSKLQYIVSDQSLIEGQALVAPFKRYIRKYVSLVKPLILLLDPLAVNISSYKKLKDTISRLLNNTGNSFYSVSDLEEVAKYFSIENDYSEAMLSQFKHPDYWLKNNMQQEAFKQFKNIYKVIHAGEKSYIPEAWDYLQDLNNYFYMSDFFFLEKFASRHFSPFRSPHEAFTSYMNAAGNFWNIKINNPEMYFKTNFLFAPTIN